MIIESVKNQQFTLHNQACLGQYTPKITRQSIDYIVEELDLSSEPILYNFSKYDDEIQNLKKRESVKYNICKETHNNSELVSKKLKK